MTEELNDKHFYYVGVDDGEHFDMFERVNSLFEATCIFYQTIKEGHEDTWHWVELGEWTEYENGDLDMETLDSHEFKEMIYG